jgi:hypothetical protein
MTRKSRGDERPVFTKAEQRAIVVEALGIVPNVWQVYRCVASVSAWATGRYGILPNPKARSLSMSIGGG